MSDLNSVRTIFQSFLRLDEKSVIEVKNNESSVYCVQNVLFVKVYNDGNDLIGAFVVKTFRDAIRGVHCTYFKSEILMYTKIIPLLSPDLNTILPRHFYSTSPESIKEGETVIVLEDLTASGFLTPKGNFLIIPEIDAIMKSIGVYHGELYSLKLRNRNEFMKHTSDVENVFFPKSEQKVYEFLADFADTVMIRHLQNHIFTNVNEDIVRKAKALLNNVKKVGSLSMTRKLREPVEPIAVLCHGDFTASNTMFKYRDDGKIDCKILDLQTPVYGSPIIDLSCVLFLNMFKSEERKSNLVRFLNIYLEDVVSRLRTNLGPNFEIPDCFNLSNFYNEFEQRCFASYFIVCFFLALRNEKVDDVIENEFPGYCKVLEVQSADPNSPTTPHLSKEVETYMSRIYDRICSEYKDACVDQVLFELTEEVLNYTPYDNWIFHE